MINNFGDIEVDIRTLGYYVDRALCVLIKRLNKELKTEGLDFHHSDFTIMKVLNETGGMTQSQLARILGKEKSGIGRSLNTLEERGYICRTEVNGCTKHVKLTDKGREMIPVLNRIADKVTDRAFSGFSDRKKRETMMNLTQIYKNSI